MVRFKPEPIHVGNIHQVVMCLLNPFFCFSKLVVWVKVFWGGG